MGGRFVDYSIPRGEREEDDEEIESKYDKDSSTKEEVLKSETKEITSESTKKEKLNFKVPRAFDEKYYADHVKVAHEQHAFDKKYILYWEQLERYAKIAYTFYAQVMCEFYKNLNQAERMPDFVKVCLNEDYNLDETAKKFKRTEEETINLMLRQGREISQVLERHKRIAELREFTSTAWLVYEDLSNKRFLPRLTKMQNKYSQLANETEEDIVAFYAGHTRANYYVPKHFLSFFSPNGDFAKNYPNLKIMYNGVNSNSIYQNLILDICGYDTKKEHANISNMANNATKQENVDIVKLYNNYNYIKYVIKKLNNIDLDKDMFAFEVEIKGTDEYRDIYKDAKEYYNQVFKLKQQLPQIAIYKKIAEDLDYLLNTLNYVLEKSKDAYEIYNQNNEKISKRLSEMQT